MTTLAQLREQPHWSYSAINSFLYICPLQWAYKYIYAEPPLFTPVSLVFGGAFHRAAEYLAGLRKQGTEIKVEEIQDIFSGAWSHACENTEPEIRFDEKHDQAALNETGRRMIAAMVDSIDPEEQAKHASPSSRLRPVRPCLAPGR